MNTKVEIEDRKPYSWIENDKLDAQTTIECVKTPLEPAHLLTAPELLEMSKNNADFLLLLKDDAIIRMNFLFVEKENFINFKYGLRNLFDAKTEQLIIASFENERKISLNKSPLRNELLRGFGRLKRLETVFDRNGHYFATGTVLDLIALPFITAFWAVVGYYEVQRAKRKSKRRREAFIDKLETEQPSVFDK